MGVANSDAKLYDEELQQLASAYPDQFRVDYALSREGPLVRTRFWEAAQRRLWCLLTCLGASELPAFGTCLALRSPVKAPCWMHMMVARACLESHVAQPRSGGIAAQLVAQHSLY
jgi:hypothetical protein